MNLGVILVAGSLAAAEPPCAHYQALDQAFRAAGFIAPDKPAQAEVRDKDGRIVDGATYRKMLAELTEARQACAADTSAARTVTKTQ
jgi:hypothetical protein